MQLGFYSTKNPKLIKTGFQAAGVSVMRPTALYWMSDSVLLTVWTDLCLLHRPVSLVFITYFCVQ